MLGKIHQGILLDLKVCFCFCLGWGETGEEAGGKEGFKVQI